MVIFSKLISTVLLVVIFSAKYAFAIDCAKTARDIEKVICSNQNLVEIDGNFNTLYNAIAKTLSRNDRASLKGSVKVLLNARDECINIYGISVLKNKIDVFDDEEFELKLQHYQLGCLLTWYNSVIGAIKSSTENPALFKVPLYAEYIALFKTFENDMPFIFEFSELDERMYKLCKQQNSSDQDYDCTYNRNTRIQSLSYTFYFPKDAKPFASKETNTYFYNAGAAHGQSSGSLKYITNREVKLSPIGRNSYTCSVPIRSPIVMGGNIYLPENISLTTVMHKLLGEYNESNCYSCSGIYKPDCLLRLRRLDGADSYLVLTKDYLDYGDDDLPAFDQKPVKYDIECVQNVVLEYADNVDEHKSKCAIKPEDENDECIFVKESRLQKMQSAIKAKCLK